MTNRVLLNTTGLKVSKAGVNVMTATNVDLLFDSDWPMLSRRAQGSFSVPPNTNFLVPFGKTFSTPPLIDVVWNGWNLSNDPDWEDNILSSYGELVSFPIAGYTQWLLELRPTGLYVKNTNTVASGKYITGVYDLWDFET